MRLLLLLSALLTAFTGAVSGGAAAAQPVQASAASAPSGSRVAIAAAVPRSIGGQAFAERVAWFVAPPALRPLGLAPFGARRRE